MILRLENITATPHASGNRIDLKWSNPKPDQSPGVRIVRKESTYPTSPDDGFIVVEGEDINSVVDKNLKGETVYYYMMFPSKGDPPEYQIDLKNRTAAMATSPYNIAGQLYDHLPGIYHRYDTVFPKLIPDEMSEEDQQRGQLRRFLDLPGSKLDQLYSFAKAGLDFHNLKKVDGHLLPLLAQWIGWKTDHTLEIDSQRNEIRNAPALYKTIGIIPTVEATVKRISGWESRTKEFVHNVFLSNRPERLNIWALYRRSSGEWSGSPELISLDFAYEGRPAAVEDAQGTLWFFYHTHRKGKWDIWYKTLFTFDVNLGFQSELDNGIVSTELQQAFEDKEFSLSLTATVEKTDSMWLIMDADNEQTYSVRQEEGKLVVYKWTPSQPLTNRGLIDKHPTGILHDETLWIFFGVYDEMDKKWHIDYRTQTGSAWSEIDSSEPFADTTNGRKKPYAVVDHDNGLWLFWLEKADYRWQLKYNRFNGTIWELDPAISFPLDAGEQPRVESDPFVLFHPVDTNQRIWVFWARKETTGGQKSWVIAYRIKQGIDPSVNDWSEIRTLPKDPPDGDYDNREPAAIVNADGNIELFWSSTKSGSWSIWRNTLDITAHTWGAEEQITNNPYSQHDSLPFLINGGTLLIYRSNKSIPYSSKVYKATKTVDFRYAGSTTVDTRNTNKISLRGKFEDFHTYTYDAGIKGKRTNEDWYARDTIGLYLATDTMDKENLEFGISRIEKVLGEFMPFTDRAVFIPRSDFHTDYIYSYGKPATPQSRFITESNRDSLISELEEPIFSPLDDFTDEIT